MPRKSCSTYIDDIQSQSLIIIDHISIIRSIESGLYDYSTQVEMDKAITDHSFSLDDSSHDQADCEPLDMEDVIGLLALLVAGIGGLAAGCVIVESIYFKIRSPRKNSLEDDVHMMPIASHQRINYRANVDFWSSLMTP